MHTYVPHIHSSGHLPIARLQVNVSKQYLCMLHLSLTCIISCHISDILAVFWATYTRKRFPAFCIVSSNELVVLYSLENSKQYKNEGKRFRVYGALTSHVYSNCTTDGDDALIKALYTWKRFPAFLYCLLSSRESRTTS